MALTFLTANFVIPGTANWTTNGITLAVAKTEDQHRPSMDKFNDAFSVVFVDPTGYMNLCADMNRGLFEQVLFLQ